MPLDIQAIIESIEILDKELAEMKREAKEGRLKAKSDETVSTNRILSLHANALNHVLDCYVVLHKKHESCTSVEQD
jgi:regulator of replication initiation timing